MAYLASHPGVTMRALEPWSVFEKEGHQKDALPTYKQAMTVHRRGPITASTAKSIAEKRAVISAKFEALKNTRCAPNVDQEYIVALETKFEKMFKKSTSGYLKGGMWDGFWRYLKMQDKWWPHYMVGYQLTEKDIEKLTPSAKRFTLILDHFLEALEQGRQLMVANEQLKSLCPPGDGPEKAGAYEQETYRAETDEQICRLVEASEQFGHLANQAIDRARAQVWPEKKHYGRRLLISGGLYLAAAIIGAIALGVSTGGIAFLAFTMTLLLRAVSLVSIRGFDRERSWKCVETLLDATEKFIKLEGDAMKTDVSLAHLRLTARIREGQDALKQGQEVLKQGQEGLQGGLQVANDKLDDLTAELRRVAIATGVYPATSNGASSSAASSASSSGSSSGASTPAGSPPKPPPAPLLRTQSLGYFTPDASRFA
ncbi:hypothetical protein [Pandoraea pneumonica]